MALARFLAIVSLEVIARVVEALDLWLRPSTMVFLWIHGYHHSGMENRIPKGHPFSELKGRSTVVTKTLDSRSVDFTA